MMIDIYGMLIEQTLGSIMRDFHNIKFQHMIEKQEKQKEKLQDSAQLLHQLYLLMLKV